MRYCRKCGSRLPATNELRIGPRHGKAPFRAARLGFATFFIGYSVAVLGVAIGLGSFLLAFLSDFPLPARALCFAGIGPAALLFHIGRRISAPRAGDLLRRDRRPPLLFLRSFGMDGVGQGSDPVSTTWMFGAGGTGQRSFEERLIGQASRFGPVVAIGKPGEVIPSAGAGRFWITDEQWKGAIRELIEDSRAIVMLMGPIAGNRGLAWEFNAILALGALRKCILVLPPLRGDSDRESIWRQYADFANTHYGLHLPPFREIKDLVAYDLATARSHPSLEAAIHAVTR